MLRCIIIDDSSVIRTVASRILGERKGIQVLEAPTGRSGYDICADNMPDVVIIDADLPDQSGVELLEQIKRLDHRGETSVLLLLAEIDLAAIMRAKRANASGFLLKPFDRETLLEVMDPLLLAKTGAKAAAEEAARSMELDLSALLEGKSGAAKKGPEAA